MIFSGLFSPISLWRIASSTTYAFKQSTSAYLPHKQGYPTRKPHPLTPLQRRQNRRHPYQRRVPLRSNRRIRLVARIHAHVSNSPKAHRRAHAVLHRRHAPYACSGRRLIKVFLKAREEAADFSGRAEVGNGVGDGVVLQLDQGRELGLVQFAYTYLDVLRQNEVQESLLLGIAVRVDSGLGLAGADPGKRLCPPALP